MFGNILSIVVFIILLLGLYIMAKKHVSFSKRVFTSLIVGIVFGLILNYIFMPSELKMTNEAFNIVGRGYVSLIKMIAMPLVMISILAAIVNIQDTKTAGKYAGFIITSLLSTAAIASIVSIIVTLAYKLNAASILGGTREIEAGQKFLSRVSVATQSISDKVVSFIPQNPFLDMTGARPTSIIAVVVFSAFLGTAILGIKRKKTDSAKIVIDLINALSDVILRLVTLVLRLTPYGVLALITKVVATSSYEEIYKLLKFVLASYTALIIMYIIHILIVVLLGLSPIVYIKKSISALIFAFTSRTSAGTIPLTISSQEDMGVDKGISNMAATFGASIGQNGCAAIYPTMLALMIAPVVGIDVYNLAFLVKVVVVVVISSLGVAGVGGGATFAAIIVLSTLGLPVELAGLLISVEPLIDMGRTALNVNDSILAGVISARLLNKLNKEKYYNKTVE
ncbi:cation:dicarboxylate symporter family transporter [Oceanivirga miroungae]|uniref:Sodium:dicarboxylate symporter n=1 Tax=Oceanivirga miroungae TaxID=1130046 RepID=A0A6I8MD72_9FUSO|nr:cation:dicarboxylase symporter family transporter [Oceanivirga miroungae]VWL85390.1 sodium:dicarboxylate symporter [Oceanivirga miroungae]